MPIGGPITKYNGECGEPGMIARARQMSWFNKSQNIESIVLLLDTPGGEARAANSIVGAIKSSSKPVLSYVDGMSASLGMWITSATQETYLSSKTDQVGSIGSYVMLADFRGALEKEGIKLHEIYAPQSVDKNKDYRDALNGDYSAIQQDLSIHVNEFISFIKSSRPSSARYEKEWNTGKMFYADDAKKFGLADGIKSFAQVVSKAAWLGKRKK
jgi:protease-4